MRLAAYLPRLFAGLAITLTHGWVIYAALTLAPQPASIAVSRPATSRPIEVRFISQAEPQASFRPPQLVLLKPAVVTTEPELAPIDLPLIAASPRAISPPPRKAAWAAPIEDLAMPKLVSAIEYLRQPSPRYPPQSRRLREQGVVVLRVLVDERGWAHEIAIEISSGHTRLDRAAREAVASAAFRPYVEDGAPRRAQVLIPIEFLLKRGSA